MRSVRSPGACAAGALPPHLKSAVPKSSKKSRESCAALQSIRNKKYSFAMKGMNPHLISKNKMEMPQKSRNYEFIL